MGKMSPNILRFNMHTKNLRSLNLRGFGLRNRTYKLLQRTRLQLSVGVISFLARIIHEGLR